MVRVMIVEANQYLRMGLKMSLENEADLTVVGELSEAAAAVEEASALEPDVILLSVELPDVSGFEACLSLLEVLPTVRIIMMTNRLAMGEIVSAMNVGSSGYLPKDGPHADLVRTVRANGQGEMFLIRQVAEQTLRIFQYNRRYVDLTQLTVREQQVLVLVADGLSNAAIGATLDISQYTVRNHISSIFAKLKVSTRAQLGAFAVMIGILVDDETHDEG